ncbi:MAG TPA: menaquinone biosynthesis protein [Candidatus Acidoferrales bacterium]|nr:menaquinone biosynthesis protein [Candidatus Acidoferrales bacterium]
MSKIRISVVQYLNTAPLVWGFTHGPLQGKYDLKFTLPSQCAEELARGEADVAILPAIECQRILGLVVLPGISIASKHEVRSLLILSRVPIEEVLRLALDTSSRATAALVRLLVAGWWSRRGARISFASAAPDLGAMLEENDAALIIGDPALRLAERHDAGEPLLAGKKARLYLYDVVSEWRAWTERPAVLALWAAREGVLARPEASELAGDFQASKEYGLAHIPEIAANAAATLGLPQAHLESYLLENINYSLDDENRAGLELYFQKAADAGLVPYHQPLKYAGEAVLPGGGGSGRASGQWPVASEEHRN